MVFGTLWIKTLPCIVPIIANQLLLGSNRREFSPNDATINKLNHASYMATTNQTGAIFFLTFLPTNRMRVCETFLPTPRLNAKEFLDGDRVGK